MTDDPAFRQWIDDAKAVPFEEAAKLAGAALKRAGSEWIGPCPACGGDDGFSFNSKKGVWNCRRAGQGGNDTIGLVMHCQSLEFIPACEALTGSPPPGRDSVPPDPDVMRERREERRDETLIRSDEQEQEREEKALSAAELFEAAGPFAGSHAEAYLRNRRLILSREQSADLRFVPALPYMGFRDERSGEPEPLGRFPCMLAAARNAAGVLIGVHRTYLDPDAPRKLVPPGDRKRNKAKKMFGNGKGVLIRLGPIRPWLAVAEGIETALSWYQFGVGPEDLSAAAAYSLGNLSGAATGTVPHPVRPGASIPNGEPDPDNPGLVLPAGVTGVVLIGDGDSEPYTTRAKLLTAGRKFRRAGLEVLISMAPDGKDFGDLWTEFQREAAQ